MESQVDVLHDFSIIIYLPNLFLAKTLYIFDTFTKQSYTNK